MTVWIVVQGNRTLDTTIHGVYGSKREAVAGARHLEGRRPWFVTIHEWEVGADRPMVSYDKRGQRGVTP